MDKVFDFLRSLRTEEIILFFKESQIAELMHSPYFLGTVAIIIVVCLVMKWRMLLAAVIAIVGFAELLAYTANQDTSLADSGIGNEALLVFIGGGIAIISMVIYLLFIKSD